MKYKKTIKLNPKYYCIYQEDMMLTINNIAFIYLIKKEALSMAKECSLLLKTKLHVKETKIYSNK